MVNLPPCIKTKCLNIKKLSGLELLPSEESFAKSINPVFGRIGAQQLGADKLTDYANRFGFDTPLQSDLSLIHI